jgi:hypothetical protein
VTAAGRGPVYNLEVEETHAFAVAGGVVVHNCADELRYVLMGLGAPAQAIDHPGFEAQEREPAYKVTQAAPAAPALAAGKTSVPALLRAASQNGRFVPSPLDRSERAMWARFAATVRRANLGQADDPYRKRGA